MNNTQRKMLDKIYSERLEKRIREYSIQRTKELSTLKEAFLEKTSADYQDLLRAGETYFLLVQKHKDDLKREGLRITHAIDTQPKLEHYTYYRDEGSTVLNDMLNDFHKETQEHIEKMRGLKDEITLRLYGTDTTFDEIDAEINKLIGDLA